MFWGEALFIFPLMLAYTVFILARFPSQVPSGKRALLSENLERSCFIHAIRQIPCEGERTIVSERPFFFSLGRR